MSFSDELNRVSRTASQAEADKNQEMYERGVREADFVYSSIKSKLMQMAHDGNYKLYNGKKKICLYHYDKWDGIAGDFKRNFKYVTVNKTFFNPRGVCADRIWLSLTNPSHYQGYMDEIIKLGREDDIQIRAVGYYQFASRTYVVDIQDAITDFGLSENGLHAALECIVFY